MPARSLPPIDPDVGIPDLVRRLVDDSRRLVSDEARLAKLEVRSGLHDGARGALWLGLSFGAGTVALVAFTVLLATLLGRLLGAYWAGTLITGALEAIAAFVLIKRGLGDIAKPSYTFEESREEIKDTVAWAKAPHSP